MLAGVCGGLGDYLAMDSTFTRIFFIILVMADGIGIFIYLVLWVIMPREDRIDASTGISLEADEIADRAKEMGQELQSAVRNPNPQVFKFVGIALILMGIFAVLDRLNISWLQWFDNDILWPLLLIMGGGFLVWRTIKGKENNDV
jgi:phage shock protein PspC (stress-responsive transcriptional regulator)